MLKGLLKKLGVGDRIRKDDYNCFVDKYNKDMELNYTVPSGASGPSLYGVHPSGTAVPEFALLQVGGSPGASGQETPIVNASEPTSSSPINLFTNGAYASPGGATNTFPLFPLTPEAPFKVAVPISGFTATIGAEIGPTPSSFLAGNSGKGLICLSTAYSMGSTKWVWACLAYTIGGGTGLAKAPAGGIGPLVGDVLGVATCSLAESWDDAGTIKIRVKPSGETSLIYNTTYITISGNSWIHWKTDNGRKIIDVDNCQTGS